VLIELLVVDEKQLDVLFEILELLDREQLDVLTEDSEFGDVEELEEDDTLESLLIDWLDKLEKPHDL
jgi:hypothetical protein